MSGSPLTIQSDLSRSLPTADGIPQSVPIPLRSWGVGAAALSGSGALSAAAAGTGTLVATWSATGTTTDLLTYTFEVPDDILSDQVVAAADVVREQGFALEFAALQTGTGTPNATLRYVVTFNVTTKDGRSGGGAFAVNTPLITHNATLSIANAVSMRIELAAATSPIALRPGDLVHITVAPNGAVGTNLSAIMTPGRIRYNAHARADTRTNPLGN